jgi:hypothetical protein
MHRVARLFSQATSGRVSVMGQTRGFEDRFGGFDDLCR